MTRYVVLARSSADGPWSEVSTLEAHNAPEAIQKAYMGAVTDELRPSIIGMVATPARSWNPTPIRVETQTKVVLGEPAPKPETSQ